MKPLRRNHRGPGPCLLPILVFGLAALHAPAQSNISPVNKWSWGENIGWTNWFDDGVTAGAIVEPSGAILSGFIWSENVGWLYLGDGAPDFGATYGNATGADTGVNIGAGGFMSGYAWGENIGWVNFDTAAAAGALAARALLCCPGYRLTGYVWGENIGWINLDSPSGFVGLVPSTPFWGGDLGDLNGDGLPNGLDIQGFIETELSPGTATFFAFCAADMNGDGVIDMTDRVLFIDCLLNETCMCP